jgi:3-oxoacyl-[acyl-carrier protein] reductase
MPGNVNDERFLAAFVDESVSTLGGIDFIVASAGGAVGRPHGNESLDDWAATYALNVAHSVKLTQLALPFLRQSACAAVVFVGSISGWKPDSAWHYAVAKAALIHAAACLARPLARLNVRVNCVSPGSVLFENGDWDRWKESHPTEFRAFVERDFPFGRLANPEEIADAIVFLLSPRARWISGVNLAVDGAQGRPTPFY